jgi:hypothetical protein
MTSMFLVKLCTINQLDGKPRRNQAHKAGQLLSQEEEKELVRWIARLTITSYLPQYDTLCGRKKSESDVLKGSMKTDYN